MKPVNSKSLFNFICEQMEKLNDKSITVQEAQAQANLMKQANNVLHYELKRAETQIKLSAHKKEFGEDIKIREIESKGFSDTTNGNTTDLTYPA